MHEITAIKAPARPVRVGRASRLPVTLLGVLFLASCGGGGNGGDGSESFSVAVDYPTPNANVGGVTQVTVTGRLINTDNDTVEFGDVNFIDVNGEMTVQDTTDPSRWSVAVPVASPGDTLAVTAEFSDGTRDTVVQSVDNQPVIHDLEGIALDAVNARALVVENRLGALIVVDLASGARTLLGEPDLRLGPRGVALDATNNRVLIASGTRDALFAVDLTSGTRTILSDNDPGNASGDVNPFLSPSAVALDAANDRALVLNAATALLAVDLTSGARTILSDNDPANSSGDTNPFSISHSVAVDPANGRALVTDDDFSDRVLLGVDLASGVRTIVSDNNAGNSSGDGNPFRGPRGVALDASNGRALVTDTNLDALLAVDLASGVRTTISDNDSGNSSGDANAFGAPTLVELDTVNNRALVFDGGGSGLLAVDLAGGVRTVLSDDHTGGAARALFGPHDVAMDTDSNTCLVVDEIRDALFVVDLSSGMRSILSDNDPGNTSGDANPFSDPIAVAADAGNDRILVVDQSLDALFAVDLVSGARSILSDNDSGNSSGDANPFADPVAVAMDAGNDRILVVDQNPGVLFAVDPLSGARSILSDNDPGNPSGDANPFSNPVDVAVDPSNDRALIADSNLNAVLAVDMSSGARTVLSDNDPGNSSGDANRFSEPISVDLDPVDNRALVNDATKRILFAVDLASGARTEVSTNNAGNPSGVANPFVISEGIAVDAARSRALVANAGLGALVVVNLDTGERAIASK